MELNYLFDDLLLKNKIKVKIPNYFFFEFFNINLI